MLNKENCGNLTANVLDLGICVENNKFNVKVYDKCDDFPFYIVNFHHISGNISKNCMYGVFKSQIIRYFNICTHEKSFRCRSGMLFNILVDKGYNKSTLVVLGL